MARTPGSAYSRRLLAASLVFGLFVLLDIALFSWLIFRSLSQREIQRVLLETRHEAETLARQIATQAEGHGKDLFRAIAVEHETQTYIDSVLKQRDIFLDVQIFDKRGVLVYKMVSRTVVPVAPPADAGPPRSPELPPGSLQGPVELKEQNRRYEYDVPSVQVPIGSLGTLVVGISGPELGKRIEVLRGELVRQATVIGVVTLILLTSAYLAVWWLLKRAARLEEQAADAERMAYIGTLASGLAHEIRNPLNSLNLNMQLLEEELGQRGPGAQAGPGGGGRLLSITRSEINRLERLVSDFLAYAKPRPLEMEEMPALWLLEHLAQLLAGDVQRRGVKLEVEDRSGGARVKVDAAQMTQLLLNVAQNGLAAMEDSGRPPVLRLLAFRHGTEVVLELVDNGVGISPEDRERIFDLFYSTRKGGTGLGLAIVDRIAKAHGGRVEIESSPGAGTAVAVHLPVAAPEAPARERGALETAGSRAV